MRSVFVLLLTLSACGQDPSSSASPDGSGPYPVTTRTLTALLGQRGKLPPSVSLTVHLPSRGDATPVPVVVFNHGFGSDAQDYATYGERLASHGFAAVLATYDKGFTSYQTHRELARDVLRVVDWLAGATSTPESSLSGRLDMERLGVAGHSRGGKQAVHAATMDSRFKACFTVDAVDAPPPVGEHDPADYPSVTPELMGSLAVPSGYVGAGRGSTAVDASGIACAPANDNFHAFFKAAPSPSYEWLLPDAGHADFTDSCARDFDGTDGCGFCAKGDDPAASHAFALRTLVAFFRVYLMGDDSARGWLDGEQVPERVRLSTR
jgi:predicted dienelactone hydrolase